ncbi:A24 family peptidase [Sphaerisporangium sp. B11E5]|uniref:A24 family peptidase n=1 Tax=Sphaerisporangium sp. B11E5 TaxID=3153563 RepID=UPI00325E151B
MWDIVFAAGFAGLLAGTFVRVLADGFAPERIPDVPPQAAERGSRWAEAREVLTQAPGRWPSWRWPPWVELGTVVACAVVAWRLQGTPCLWSWGYGAVAGSLLSVIDWRTRRLPDVITLPSYPILAVLLIPTGHLGYALLGGLALGGAYAVLWYGWPHALGLGDAKLAGLVGMLAGSLGMDRWVAAAMGGLVLGALYAVLLLLTGRGTLKTQFPLGPFIAAGALAALY